MTAPDPDSTPSHAEALSLLVRLGLAGAGDTPEITPLTGGVSSDIWVVRDASRRYVLKHAREQLKVDAAWHAPVDRGASEVAWLRFAGDAVPGACPRVLGYDPDTHAIALEYLDPATHFNWKSELLAGRVDVGFARAVGGTLGRIHAASTTSAGVREAFANQELFESLRIQPYLVSAADAVPEVRDAVLAVVDGLRATQVGLVHGDVSPKNILTGPAPVILDAECATWGDPAFDAAFCLNHLVLKSIHLRTAAPALREAARAFTAAYLAQVNWEPALDLAGRTNRILPALMLARVAGKSPAEYLTTDERGTVRDLAVTALATGAPVRGFDVVQGGGL